VSAFRYGAKNPDEKIMLSCIFKQNVQICKRTSLLSELWGIK